MHLTRASNHAESCHALPDWVRVPVRQMGSVVTGKALAVNAPGPLRPYLRTKNVFDGRIDVSDVLTMPMTDEEFARFEARPGDVLLNEGQSLELVGRCAMYGGEYPVPCAIQNQLIRFRARAGVSNSFACHLFRWCQRSGVFARVALQTTSIAHLGGKRFERLVLAWPPTEAEQTSIATALSDVDGLIASLDRLIAKKRAVKQAAMQQLLTGKSRLPGFTQPWRGTRMSSLIAIRNEKVVSSRVDPHTPCIELEHIGQGDGNLMGHTQAGQVASIKYRFQAGDVLFGRLRAYLRKYWLADRNGLCTTEIWPLQVSPDTADAAFVHAIVQTTWFIEAACISYGTHMPRADWSVIRNLTLEVPDKWEQSAIGRVFRDLDSEIQQVVRRRDKVKAIKQGMMQALLTGRIRLPVALGTEAAVAEPVAQAEPTKGHNWQINEAVVIGILAKNFGSEAYPLGRKRYTKLSYLLHRRAERTADGYLKKAAGPYNPSTKYGGPEKIALKNRYVREHTNGQYKGFVAGDGIAQAEGYFEKWYGPEALKWLEQFRKRKNDALGVLATVDMASEELRAAGREVTVQTIKGVLAADKEWKQKLTQPEFSDRNIAAAIEESDRLFGVGVAEAQP